MNNDQIGMKYNWIIVKRSKACQIVVYQVYIGFCLYTIGKVMLYCWE